jgi:putative endonuclease
VLDAGWRAPERELQGDIDLVVRRDDLIVFCEVKARKSARYGGAVAAVTPAKQAQVRRLAESWLRVSGSPEVDVRFDVIAIDGVDLTHYDAAF